ncbi:hypothetical protein [Sedimentitalea arenosa]|nr:hypothetical protein [Arenibacterium arenosum]
MKEMQEELERIEKSVASLVKRGVKSYSISATCVMSHNDLFYVASPSDFVLTSADGGAWTYPQVDLKVGDVITVSAAEECSYMNDASNNMIATTSAAGGYVDYTPAPSDDPEKMKHWFTLQAQ